MAGKSNWDKGFSANYVLPFLDMLDYSMLRDGVFLGRGIQEVEVGPLSGQQTFAVTAYFEMI